MADTSNGPQVTVSSFTITKVTQIEDTHVHARFFQGHPRGVESHWLSCAMPQHIVTTLGALCVASSSDMFT